jgi:molybdopterin biosynthesis enzyme
MVLASVESGRYVRPAGQDFRAGDQILPAGRAVTPGVIALAAAAGRRDLGVHRRPRVALLATGNRNADATRSQKHFAPTRKPVEISEAISR